MGAMASQSTSLMIVTQTFITRKSKKTSKLRVTGLCEGNSPVTGEFPAHDVTMLCWVFIQGYITQHYVGAWNAQTKNIYHLKPLKITMRSSGIKVQQNHAIILLGNTIPVKLCLKGAGSLLKALVSMYFQKMTVYSVSLIRWRSRENIISWLNLRYCYHALWWIHLFRMSL